MAESIVPRVIEILLLGQKMKDVEHQRKRDELSDELLRERISDLRWKRKQKDPLMELGLQILQGQGGTGAGLGGIDFSQIKDPIAQAGLEKAIGGNINWSGYEPKTLTESQRYYKEHPEASAGSWLREQKKIGKEFEKPREYDFERDIQRVLSELSAGETGMVGPKTPPDILKRQATKVVTEKEFPALRGKEVGDQKKEITALKNEWRKYRLGDEEIKLLMRFPTLDPKGQEMKEVFEYWAADLDSGVRIQLGKDLGFYKIGETFGQPRQTKKQKSQRPEKPINYSSMAEGLKKLYGVQTKKTLQAHRSELESSYPGLNWEELKKHFK